MFVVEITVRVCAHDIPSEYQPCIVSAFCTHSDSTQALEPVRIHSDMLCVLGGQSHIGEVDDIYAGCRNKSEELQGLSC